MAKCIWWERGDARSPLTSARAADDRPPACPRQGLLVLDAVTARNRPDWAAPRCLPCRRAAPLPGGGEGGAAHSGGGSNSSGGIEVVKAAADPAGWANGEGGGEGEGGWTGDEAELGRLCAYVEGRLAELQERVREMGGGGGCVRVGMPPLSAAEKGPLSAG